MKKLEASGGISFRRFRLMELKFYFRFRILVTAKMKKPGRARHIFCSGGGNLTELSPEFEAPFEDFR
jgi:hypothetical protein